MTKLNYEMRRRWEKTKPQKEGPGRGEKEDSQKKKAKKQYKKRYRRLRSPEELEQRLKNRLECPLCHRFFPTRETCKWHLLSHHNVMETKLQGIAKLIVYHASEE
jgi:hypothetical protein